MELPKLKDFKLYEPISSVPGTLYDFAGVYTDAEGNQYSVTVFTTPYFIDNICQLFRNRLITLPEDNAENTFLGIFQNWRESRKDLYIKQAYAYTLKYNPIENYSSTEIMTDDETVHEKGASYKDDFHNTDTDTLTPFTKETTETTPYTKETTETTPYTKETTTVTGTAQNTPTSSTTNSKMAFNSSTFVDTDKSETTENSKSEFAKTGTEKIELTKTGTEKVELTKTGTEEHEIEHTGYIEHTTDGRDTDTRNYTLTKRGNIGVQTAAEMLQKEYDGLMQDLAFRALKEFVDRYSFYSDCVE